MEKKIKLLAVCGPTASGKTALGVALARAYSGEVISCDSMQIYRGMEIGTAKPTKEEMGEIPHHLLDFCDPETTFSVVDYTTRAAECIEDITARGTRPILVGGTGLYARSLLRSVPRTAAATKSAPRCRKNLKKKESGRFTRVCRRLIRRAQRKFIPTTQSA